MTTFTFHDLLDKAKIEDFKERTLLGIQMGDAYKQVTGEKATQRKVGKKFKVNEYPEEWLPIANNIINNFLKKSNT